MKYPKHLSVPVIGLALFSMFFGSGNLIYPLSVGQMAHGHLLWGVIGFLVTGVLLPFGGVLTMVLYSGDYTRFFSQVGRKLGFILTATLLTAWIPLGSAPRCVTLAFANMRPYLGGTSLLLFSFVYCVVLFLFVWRKSRAIDMLGYVLTPLLLLCLGITIFQGLRLAPELGAPTSSGLSVLGSGLLEGYNTMDLIASFFFSATIIGMLKSELPAEGGSARQALPIALKASAVGIGILATVYIGLMVLAAFHMHALDGVGKDQLLAALVMRLLGPELRVISTTAVALACFTTSVALAIVYAEFIKTKIFGDKIDEHRATMLTVLMTLGMSIAGFDAIAALTVPAMKILYPTLITLMVADILLKGLRDRKVQAHEQLSVEG